MAFTRTDLAVPSVPYVHQDYPRHVTHTDGRTQIVPNEAAWALLGAEWGYVAPVVEPARKTAPEFHSEPPPEPKRRKARG